jgi:large subunit ribosomal protein L13e
MDRVKPKILKQNGKQRSGRGFSPEELKKAGLKPTEAARLGLPTDRRRKTAHDENVEVVKAYVEKKKAEAKLEPKKKPKS